MSTAIGSRMIKGDGVKYHSTGNGMARNIASNVISYIGHAGINKLASLVKGSGYKLTGTGAHKKKAGRPKKAKTHHKKK